MQVTELFFPHQYIAQLLAAFEQRASAQNPKDQASLSSTFFSGDPLNLVTLSTSPTRLEADKEVGQGKTSP